MALRLNNVGGGLIKKLECWSSAAWLTYIHSQIISISTGLSEKFPFAMSSIMLAHKVVGPYSQSSKGFLVIPHVTQITNDVMLSLAYYQDKRHYPSQHADLTGRGR